MHTYCSHRDHPGWLLSTLFITAQTNYSSLSILCYCIQQIHWPQNRDSTSSTQTVIVHPHRCFHLFYMIRPLDNMGVLRLSLDWHFPLLLISLLQLIRWDIFCCYHTWWYTATPSKALLIWHQPVIKNMCRCSEPFLDCSLYKWKMSTGGNNNTKIGSMPLNILVREPCCCCFLTPFYTQCFIWAWRYTIPAVQEMHVNTEKASRVSRTLQLNQFTGKCLWQAERDKQEDVLLCLFYSSDIQNQRAAAEPWL